MSEHHHVHGGDHTELPSDLVLRVQALESLLVEKGLVDLAGGLAAWREGRWVRIGQAARCGATYS